MPRSATNASSSAASTARVSPPRALASGQETRHENEEVDEPMELDVPSDNDSDDGSRKRVKRGYYSTGVVDVATDERLVAELVQAMRVAPSGASVRNQVLERVARDVRRATRRPIASGGSVRMRVIWLARVLQNTRHAQHARLSTALKRSLHEYLALRDKRPPSRSRGGLREPEAEEDVQEEARGATQPTASAVAVLNKLDETFVGLLLETKQSSRVRGDVWTAVVAALGGAHPFVSTSRCAVKRIAWLKSAAGDASHPHHSSLSESLKAKLRQYEHGHPSSAATSILAAEPRPRTERPTTTPRRHQPKSSLSAAPVIFGDTASCELLVERLERERAEHRDEMRRVVATAREEREAAAQAAERASARQHAQLLGVLELARAVVARAAS